MPYKSIKVNHYRGKMGQNQRLELSEEDKKALSIGLLREWWLAATQALVDEAGSEKALNHLKPYFLNTGSAGAQNIPKIHGVSTEEFLSYDILFHMWPMVTGGRIHGVFIADDGSRITEIAECATSGRSREGCICMCGYTVEAAVRESSPGYEMSLKRSLSFGDQVCVILGEVMGLPPQVAPTSEFKIPDEQLPPLKAKDVWVYLALSYIGECWSNATRAFIDTVGSEGTLCRLRFQMKNSGQSFGTKMAEQYKAWKGGKQSILDLIDFVQVLHQRKGVTEKKEGEIEGTVNECPFSASQPEMCLQYEAFFNGICEAIDPSFEFAYDRMMTKGDKTCHWTIRKKGETAKETVGETPSSEVNERKIALKALAFKYAQGEITKDEYNELKEIIQ
jgi:predicted hydrocarbon binding protein